MAEMRPLSNAQKGLLKELATVPKLAAKGVNRRTYQALQDRGLAKVREQKAGTFLSITAKGKKELVE